MDKRKIILDVDTGSDDAVAIITALLSPEFDVLGLASVNGNRCVEFTTENTLRVKELLESDVPVYRGCGYPIVSTVLGKRPGVPQRDNTREFEVHGNFLDMIPEATIVEEDLDAVSWYVKTLMAAKDNEITIVPVGPITNLANAIAIEPRIVPKIKEVMFMGGGFKIGNKTAAAEYNVWVDPEAAQIVLEQDLKLTFVTLDATHDAYLSLTDAKKIRKLNTPVAKVVAELIERRVQGYTLFQTVEIEDAAPIHDPLCILGLLDPTIFTEILPAHCAVDLGDGAAYGQTIFDIKNGRVEAKPDNCFVALSADTKKFSDMVYDIVSRAK